jgi:PKD repeat protein
MKRRFTQIFILLALVFSGQLFAAQGGPDAYGYTWKDSNEPGGPTYMWLDTNANWMNVNGLADDNSVGPYSVGWDFHYYWGDFTQFKIGSNGWISFDNVSNIASCFPSIPTQLGAGDNYVAPLMSDLTFISSFPAFPNISKCKYWSNLKDTLVVSFFNVPWWQAGTPDWYGSNTFQVLFDGTDSSITFNYKQMSGAFTQNFGCNNDLQVGIENSTGAVGLQCWNEVAIASNYSIKFQYPQTPLMSVKDLAPLWNQNSGNGGDFFPTGLIPTLQSKVKNVGNASFTNSSTVTGNLRNMSFTSVYTATRTMPTWAAGLDSLLVFTPQAVINTAGQYYWEVTSNNNLDMNPGNNTNSSEIELVNLSGPTAQLTYTTGGGNTYSWGWNGGGTDDGVGVYMYPPVHPMAINSVEVFIASASTSGFIVSIFADDGPNGSPGTLLKTDTIPFSSVVIGNWNTVNYPVPVSVATGGYYVAWMMGGADMYLGTEDVGPISRRSYEILGGAWSTFRDNNLREPMFRVNIGGYPCAISSGFSYTNNLNSVSFSNQSTGGTSYHWDFGDGQTSTSLSPNHTYTAFGTYTVCLISTNSCGSDTTCMPVSVVCPNPGAAFTHTYLGISFQFLDNSSSTPSSWAWDFGDGGTSSLQNPTHSYANPGNYTVCLIATNACGSDTSCVTVTACVLPTAGFNSSTNSLIASFANTSSGGTTYFWNFGDGSNSLAQNPSHTYATAGTYNVCLITFNACYSDTLCQSVTVCALPVPIFTSSVNQFAATFNNTTAGTNTWAWDFGDGGTSSAQNPSHTYTANGTYTVCLIATNSCGADTICHTVTISVVAVTPGISEAQVMLYPNPTGGQLKVSMTLDAATDLQLRIRDVAGKVVANFGSQQAVGEWKAQLDVSALASGMYMLEIQSQDFQIVKKFVKQ